MIRDLARALLELAVLGGFLFALLHVLLLIGEM
jgi:hypothetical protein